MVCCSSLCYLVFQQKDFLLQKARPCANPRRLSHFVWKSVEGSDPSIGDASYGAVGHVPPSTSNCLIFQVTSEPHKLWHFDSIVVSCPDSSVKKYEAYSLITAYCINFTVCIFVCHRDKNTVKFVQISPVNYFLIVSCPLAQSQKINEPNYWNEKSPLIKLKLKTHF